MAKIKLFGEKGFFRRAAGRNLVIVLSVLVLGAAVYLNYLYFFNGNTPSGGTEGVGGDSNVNTPVVDDGDTVDAYFAAASLSRQEARDEAIAVLQTVVNSEDALTETKDEALSEISRIALDIEKERNIETLVKAKGFADCIALLSNESASVIVRQDSELLPNQIAQIKEIVYSESSILPASIKIIRK